jgi:hypothetical protein
LVTCSATKITAISLIEIGWSVITNCSLIQNAFMWMACGHLATKKMQGWALRPQISLNTGNWESQSPHNLVGWDSLQADNELLGNTELEKTMVRNFPIWKVYRLCYIYVLTFFSVWILCHFLKMIGDRF